MLLAYNTQCMDSWICFNELNHGVETVAAVTCHLSLFAGKRIPPPKNQNLFVLDRIGDWEGETTWWKAE